MAHKITIVTGAWQRHHIFKFFCAYYERLKKKFPGLRVVISCSERETVAIAKKHGHDVVQIGNGPLWMKMNASANKAIGSDYTILVGSDDIITPAALRYYIEIFNQGIDYIYPLDFYFYDTITQRAAYWGGYTRPHNRGTPCGAGRALSNSLMTKLAWCPWMAGYDHVLDSALDRKLAQLDFKHHGFSLRQNGIFAMDIKSETNMTKFSLWENTVYLDAKTLLKKHMPNEWKEIMALGGNTNPSAAY